MAERTTNRRLALARAERDLTQRELAELAGLDQETVRRIEAGLVRPRVRTRFRIAMALGLEAEDLWPDLRQEAS